MNMKKFVSMFLALIMVLAMAIPAMADEVTTPETPDNTVTEGTENEGNVGGGDDDLTDSVPAITEMEGELTGGVITIDNAVEGQTYAVYQLLWLESYNADTEAYSYKMHSAWKAFFESEAINDVYVEIVEVANENGTEAHKYVTWKEGADVEAFAKLADAYAKANGIAPSAAPVKATSAEVKFTDLKLGYYLVDTTMGALCSLDTTNPTVTIEEKNEAPEVVKEVKEDYSETGANATTDDGWGVVNDASIGQKVEYRAIITVKKGTENYQLHDNLSDGLTLDQDNFNVYIGKVVDGELVEDTLVDETNYTVTFFADTDVCTCDYGANCDFKVEFKNEFILAQAADTKIIVRYDATVDEDAIIAGAGNPNSLQLGYGDVSDPEWTPEDTTVTYVWKFDLYKYTMVGGQKTPLADAKFVLFNTTKEKVAQFQKDDNTATKDGTDYKFVGWADYTADMDLEAYKIVTPADGKVYITGLDSTNNEGINADEPYYLRETDAPAGYNKLSSDYAVTITSTVDGDVTDATASITATANTVEVENKSGTELPSTGSTGTTMIYIMGGMMMMIAAVLMISKKRAEA